MLHHKGSKGGFVENWLARIISNIRIHQAGWIIAWFVITVLLGIPLLLMDGNETIEGWTKACFFLWSGLTFSSPFVLFFAPDHLYPEGWDS